MNLDPVEAGNPSQGGKNSDLNDEPASNAGYIVIVKHCYTLLLFLKLAYMAIPFLIVSP